MSTSMVQVFQVLESFDYGPNKEFIVKKVDGYYWSDPVPYEDWMCIRHTKEADGVNEVEDGYYFLERMPPVGHTEVIRVS